MNQAKSWIAKSSHVTMMIIQELHHYDDDDVEGNYIFDLFIGTYYYIIFEW